VCAYACQNSKCALGRKVYVCMKGEYEKSSKK
jgi:hypothetical protein